MVTLDPSILLEISTECTITQLICEIHNLHFSVGSHNQGSHKKDVDKLGRHYSLYEKRHNRNDRYNRET